MSAETFPGIEQFRVLVVDDEASIREEIMEQLIPTGMIPLEATTAPEAFDLLEHRYVDAAIVDIKLGKTDAGREVLRVMSRDAPAATAVIATKYTDRLGEFIGITKPRLVEIVEKGPQMPVDWARRPLEQAYNDWKGSRVTIQNLELVVGLLQDRADRIERLRAEIELAAEVERICRRLFGSVTVEGSVGIGDITIKLKPIEREGLSAAITVEAEVHLGSDHASRAIRGNRVVMKIGRSADIAAEAERYHTFVKYGVPLTHRVELLGHTEDRTIGAACYSFAGNVFGSSLESLDEQLRSPERQNLVNLAMYSLFDRSSKSWDGVTGEPIAAMQYIRKTYGTNFESCRQVVEDTVNSLRHSLGSDVTATSPDDRTDGALSIGQARLRIPSHTIWGSGLFLRRIETCLVHGDMHGGNVMVELDEEGLRRVCLIDYRNAGPGPRATDVVALDASVRLADLQALLAEHEVENERELDEDGFRSAAMACAARVREERKILSVVWDEAQLRWTPREHWATTSIQLASLARTNFETLAIKEMLAMAMPAAYRHIGYDIGVLGRVRFLAWLSALYERFDQQR